MTTSAQPPVSFEKSMKAFMRDRWKYYRTWRDQTPVMPVRPTPGEPPTEYMISRYEDVAAILRSPHHRVTAEGFPDPKYLGDGAAAAMYRVRMVLNDPPHHTRLRKLSTPVFTPKAINKLAESIRRAVEGRLQSLVGCDEVDIVAEFSSFVPATVVCSILDIEFEPHGRELIARTADYAHIFTQYQLDPQTFDRCERACAYYIEWFTGFVEQHSRRADASTVVGALLKADEAGDQLTTIELVGLLHAFLSAGYQTTMNAISSSVLGLLREPLTFAWLREHPQAVPRAVDEILRWDPPVHFARRFLGCETTLQGVTLEEGTEVRLCLAAANRDERKFDDPDRLELTRSNAAEHLSFGGGRHFCIGAYLARVEATIAVASLIHRFPKMELIDHEPPRRKHVAFPLIERMRLRLGPASSSPGESAHPLSEGERPHMYL